MKQMKSSSKEAQFPIARSDSKGNPNQAKEAQEKCH